VVRAFISCALTHVPRDEFNSYVTFIHDLANTIRSSGCDYVSYALIDSDPQLALKPAQERAHLCYLWDHELVARSDVLIAEATYPSIGTGIELEIASALGRPIILCYEQLVKNRIAPIEYENPDHKRHRLQIGEGFVSLMALGIPTVYRVVPYAAHDEALVGVAEALKVLIKGA
jgi:hypothetical protein